MNRSTTVEYVHENVEVQLLLLFEPLLKVALLLIYNILIIRANELQIYRRIEIVGGYRRIEVENSRGTNITTVAFLTID